MALFLAVVAGYFLLQGSPVSWHPILRVCLAVTALVIGVVIWGKRESPSHTVAQPARAPRWLDYLTVGVALLLVECIFLFILATAPDRAESLAMDLDERLHPESYPSPAPAEEDGPGGGKGPRVGSANWLWRGKGEIRLQSEGSVRPSNRPEVYLWPTSDNDASLLKNNERFLRIFTLANYENGIWSPLPSIPRTLTATGSRLLFAPPSERTVNYEVSHQSNALGRSLAVTIPSLNAIEVPFLRESAPGTFRLPPLPEGEKTHRYAVTSSLTTFDTLPSHLALQPDTDTRPEYLQLPVDDQLRQRILDLASGFNGSSRDALVKLRQHLRLNYSYSLEVELTDATDPLEDFLFETRSGYCTHFSSAAALLARALGFPARVAFGWSGGRYFEGPNFYVFRGREAHAWTEIHLKDHGWVIFDATPASRSEGISSTAEKNEDSPLESDHLSEDDAGLVISSLAPLKTAALWIGSASLIVFIIAVFARRPKEQNAATNSALSFLPPSPNYFALFKRACSAHGYPMPAGRTLRAHLTLIPAPDFTTELLNYHYAVHYADAPRNKKKEKELIQQLRQWERDRHSV